MRVLVACEFSGIVRDAFIAEGHDAMSCDFLSTERPGPHHEGDVFDVVDACWDLMIAHPPCTHLAVSGARHFPEKRMDGRQAQGLSFFMRLIKVKIPAVCVENPISIVSSIYRKPDQIIQPYQFGHPESKSTCLWLRGLPKLKPTKILTPQWKKNPDGTDYRDSGGSRYSEAHFHPERWANQTKSDQNKLPPSKDRWKIRSKTYQGIAETQEPEVTERDKKLWEPIQDKITELRRNIESLIASAIRAQKGKSDGN